MPFHGKRVAIIQPSSLGIITDHDLPDRPDNDPEYTSSRTFMTILGTGREITELCSGESAENCSLDLSGEKPVIGSSTQY